MIRRLALTISLVAAILAVAAPAFGQDGVRVAAGVSSGGVDLSGLTPEEARYRLDQQLARVLGSKVNVQVGARTFTLYSSNAGFDFDVTGTANAALAAAPGTVIAPKVRYSKPQIAAFVTTTAAAVRSKPRDATIRIGLKKIRIRKSKPGQRISNAGVVAAIERAFTDPTAPRLIVPRLLPANPRVSESDLRRQYRTVLTASKREFKVRLFKNLKMVKSYKIATGQPAYPTPSGRFRILDKAVNPTWSVPNSPWAGELQGSTVAGGSASNPLKARWMGIGNGIGFHGTGQEYSVGTRASHGCMRMRVKDIIALYPRVPVGTTVLVR